MSSEKKQDFSWMLPDLPRPPPKSGRWRFIVYSSLLKRKAHRGGDCCARFLVDQNYYLSIRSGFSWDITHYPNACHEHPWGEISSEVCVSRVVGFFRIDLSGAGVGAHGYKAAGFLFLGKPAVWAWSGSLQFCFSWWSVARAAVWYDMQIFTFVFVLAVCSIRAFSGVQS